VEKGVPPTLIMATKFVADDKAKGVTMPRPLCPFPQVAKYKGTGEIADAANFACAVP
jgi:feruloyl esterase